jgi:predicted DsbA family dithiol-disulfide isomerase
LAAAEPVIVIKWKAFELRPSPVPALRPDDDYLTTIWHDHVYPLAEKMGFTMKLPPVQPRTRLAHAAAKWADTCGSFAAFNNALFKALFQDGLDIGKIGILRQIAENSGLDPHGLDTETQLEPYIRKVVQDEELAGRVNVRAVPAFVVNGRVLAAGVQSTVRLQQLLSQV